MKNVGNVDIWKCIFGYSVKGKIYGLMRYYLRGLRLVLYD